jgi:hypothetical protein
MPTSRDESFGLPAGQVGIAALVIIVFAVTLAFFPDHLLLVLGGLTAVVGTGKLVVRQLRAHDGENLPPASPAFRALADPKRPLTADDPVSGEREPK